MMAGIDGVRNKKNARDLGWGPFSDISELNSEEARKIISLPETFEQALESLRADHEYLKYDDVFSQALINAWISSKFKQEINPMKDKPTPSEFKLYFNC